MNRIKNIFYAIFLAFLFCNPTCAQNNVKITKVGKLIQESLPSTWERDTFMTYYIAADADSTERFIKEGNWKAAYEKRYTPYNNVSLPLIRKCFAESISAVLTEEQKKHLTQEQIYEILRLYSKCELPIHPVVGAFKEKEYYITGANFRRIK